jgi:cbb3-type cytochrome oxidase subunit 3
MDWRGWVYSIFTLALFIVFVFIVIRYYGANKKQNEQAEKPKYRMLDDDDTPKNNRSVLMPFRLKLRSCN